MFCHDESVFPVVVLIDADIGKALGRQHVGERTGVEGVDFEEEAAAGAQSLDGILADGTVEAQRVVVGPSVLRHRAG